MSEASNSRSLQKVYKITVFDILETRLPACFVIVHFTHAARQLMAKRGQDVLLAEDSKAPGVPPGPAYPSRNGDEGCFCGRRPARTTNCLPRQFRQQGLGELRQERETWVLVIGTQGTMP